MDDPILILSGTLSQHNSVGQRSGTASDGAAQSMPVMARTRAVPTVNRSRKARRHVGFAASAGNKAMTTLASQCHSSRNATQAAMPTWL
ncbi:unnamed protein product [Closterium sp. NIES-54]